MKRGLNFYTLAASAILLAVVLASFGVLALAVNHLTHAGKAALRSTQVISTADELETNVLGLETGLRGYLLARERVDAEAVARYLVAYRAAIAEHSMLAAELEAETAGNPAQHARATQIAAAIDAYVHDWSAPQLRRARTDLIGARRAEASGGGTRMIDAIAAQFDVLTAAQRVIDGHRAHRENTDASWALGLAFGGMAVCALLVVALVLVMRRHIVLPTRRLARGVGRLAAGELSVRVPGGGIAEVGALTHGFNVMAESLEQQRDELENQTAELEAQQIEIESAIETVEEQRERAELLRRVGDELAAVSELEEVGNVALRTIGDVAGAEIGALYLLREQDGSYALAARRGLAQSDVVDVLVVGDGLAGRALGERVPVGVSYGETSLRLPGLVTGRDAAHELHLPLHHGDRTIGVVSLGRARDEPFTPDEIALLEGLAQRTSVAAAEALSLRRLETVARELETLLASTDEGIYDIDRNGSITLVNRAALELTGYTLEEVLGKNGHRLLHHTRPDGSVYPEEDCAVLNAITRGEGCRIDTEVFWRKDGTPFPVEYSAYPLYEGEEITGAVVTFVDISSRKRAERQRDTQHAVTGVLADAQTTPEALPALLATICDGLGCQLGFAWQPLDDGTALHSYASHATPGYEATADRLTREGVAVGSGPAGLALARGEAVLFRDLDAEPARPGLVLDTPLRSAIAVPIEGLGGELLGIAEFFSEKSLDEEGLIDTLQTFAGQTAQFIERQRAELQTEQMRKEFVATVSHELRTPLTSIDGWLQVLLSDEAGPLNDEQRQFLLTVKRNSDRLIRLVGDLLLEGQIESGKLTLELEHVDVAHLALEAAELVQATAAAKEIDVHVDVAEGAVVHGDRARLMQLLNNLLANAVKFTPAGGHVDLDLSAENGSCRLVVSDTGIGIPADERDRLFERFYRASSAREHGIAGTGLGLAISKAIAESHGGTIRIDDRDGPGTSFVVELPLASDHD